MKKKRLGEERYNNKGCKMKIIEYNNACNIIVEFQDEYKAKVHSSYQMFKKGIISNPYYPNVYGVGYVGVGKYSEKEYQKIYDHWHDMIKRCYDPYFINKKGNIVYKDVFVEEDLLNLQNFGKWFEENYYEIPNEVMCLDKDILFKGNKIYSRDTMIFVPKRINTLFTKGDKCRGNLPIGVTIKKDKDKINLYVSCSTYKDGKRKCKYLGRLPINRPFQAFTIYKNFKEKYIKQVADEYKGLIPEKLYNAMYNYEVEIND